MSLFCLTRSNFQGKRNVPMYKNPFIILNSSFAVFCVKSTDSYHLKLILGVFSFTYDFKNRINYWFYMFLQVILCATLLDSFPRLIQK